MSLHKGKISFKNLKRVAKELGENLTDDELQVSLRKRPVNLETLVFFSLPLVFCWRNYCCGCWILLHLVATCSFFFSFLTDFLMQLILAPLQFQ